MNIKSFPNNQDVYIGAEDVMRWHHGRTSGVFGAENNAAVSAIGGMAVSVSDGIGWISNDKGYGVSWWIDNEAEGKTKPRMSIDMADAEFARIDRVIISWETTDYVALPELKVLKGTAAANPVAPTLTNNNVLRQISLASIKIPAGATEITSTMITDERLDTSVCGIVTEAVKADTSMMNAQYRAAIELLETAIAQAWDGQIPDGSITAEKLAPGVGRAQDFSGSFDFKWLPPGDANEQWDHTLFDVGYYKWLQVATVYGVNANDTPIADVDLTKATNADEAIAYRNAWRCIDRIAIPADNTVVAYCFEEKPAGTVPFTLKVVR